MPLPSPPDWTPGPHAIEIEAAFDPQDRAPGFLGARHATTPCVRYFEMGADDPANRAEFEAALRAFALRYLRALTPRVQGAVPERERTLLAAWLDALAGNHPRFGWLPLEDGKPGPPMLSFRSGDTVVLLASERLADTSKPSDFIASGFGLRVVGHLWPVAGDAPHLAFGITSFAASLPFGAYRDGSLVYENAADITLKAFFELLTERSGEISTALNLDRPWFTQMRVHRVASDRVGFEVQGTSYDASPGVQEAARPEDRTPYGFIVRGVASDEGEIRSLDSFERRPLVAYAAEKRTVFTVDPASAGPPADFRARGPGHAGALGKYLRDVMVEPSAAVEVAMAKLERPDFGKSAPAATGVASDAFGEASARTHLERFMARLEGWGFTPKNYFKVAKLPIKGLARAGIRPGPGKDGITVNARVALGSWSASFFGQVTPQQQPVITMYFAAGEIFGRTRLPRPRDGYAPAEYLGVAADPRWVWHEIGHALLAGNVGELEFRFAHSAGDALAAIALDPQSRLDGRARGATFPWVFVPRRHDRCAAAGWSWRGAVHQPAALRARPDLPAFKGYWSEQILSSTLFRLYRALGGDAVLASGLPDRPAREAASDYTLYLIVKAIGLFAYKGALSDNTPDFLATALIDADRGTGAFTTTVDDGGTPRTFARAGGWAHKVIRWAFERQGLYARGFANGPGEPPAVDLYIGNRRPAGDAAGEGPAPFGPGSYAPVSLEWRPGDGDAPWHAAAEAIEIDSSGRLFVTVGNRGAQPASGVQVKVYARGVTANAMPTWEAGAGWLACGAPASAPPDTIAAGATRRYGAFTLPQGLAAPFVVLAVASCPDDRANVDPATGLPCATLPVRVADLVGGDNNLGLRCVR